jgi:hypothetical protein
LGRKRGGPGTPPPLPVLCALCLGATLYFGISITSSGSAAAAQRCIDGSADEASIAGSDEGPPKFKAAFFRRVMTLDASTDGVDGKDLPISIEEICGLPRSLEKQAAQLVGNDGVALTTSRTVVVKDGQRLASATKLVELDGADTVRIKARLLTRARWKVDEDGEPVPTFAASRVVITD